MSGIEMLLSGVRSIILEAGAELMRLSAYPLHVSRKDNKSWDLLSTADLAIQSLLIEELGNLLPEADFLSEEEIGHGGSGLVWVIDPIDGTTNFIVDQNNYAISLALYDQGVPLFGFVYDVARGYLYEGLKGGGAYRNGVLLPKIKHTPLDEVLLEGSLASFTHFLKEGCIGLLDLPDCIQGHRCLGSCSLSLCNIALGKRHVYVSNKVYSWDYAAAAIVLEETGGKCAPLRRAHKLDRSSHSFLAAASPELWDLMETHFQLG